MKCTTHATIFALLLGQSAQFGDFLEGTPLEVDLHDKMMIWQCQMPKTKDILH